MLEPDQEPALQTLADSIRGCIETIGPACTARLLGTVALDLIEPDKHFYKPKLPGPGLDGQGIFGQRAGIRFRHRGASQRLRRHTGYPSATTR